MIFTSTIFIFAFLPIVLVGGILLKKHTKASNAFLCVMSLIFYTYGEPRYIIVMLLSIVGNFGLALLIEKSRYRNFLLVVAVFLNIGLLFGCKYLNWTIYLFNRIFHTSFHNIGISLPIGISFYTFQALSYVIDVWRRKTAAQKNLISIALYISFFPQLVAGPIVRYTDIETQIRERAITLERMSEGIERFIVGFSKKVLLADSFAIIVDKAFTLNYEGILGTCFAWAGAIAYTMQIYFDFSGYSDMAIGLGKMFGFTFPENFNYPYMAATITDFWRRWHMSLSQWFRDYVYIPLGGNKHGTSRMVISLAVTWLATGIWHGANITFILWGVIYGSLIIIEKLFRVPECVETRAVGKVLYRGFSVLVIVLCWVIFRADSISEAIHYITTMFCMDFQSGDFEIVSLYMREYIWEIVAGVLLCFPIGCWLKEKKGKVIQCGILGVEWLLFVVSISYLVKGTYSPFIYFNF